MKVFIAGPRVVKVLDKNIIEKLESICKNKDYILIGESVGIDASVQKFLVEKGYKNVVVYASNGIARNNHGNWKVENIDVGTNVKSFSFCTKKDLEMAKDSDVGLMIWNGESRGTFNNIINLLTLKKEVILYFLPTQKFYNFSEMESFEKFLHKNVEMNSKLLKLLPSEVAKHFK